MPSIKSANRRKSGGDDDEVPPAVLVPVDTNESSLKDRSRAMLLGYTVVLSWFNQAFREMAHTQPSNVVRAMESSRRVFYTPWQIRLVRNKSVMNPIRNHK